MKKRKVSVVLDIVGPRLPDLFDIEEEEFEKNTQKIALLLFKPHRNSAQLLGTKRKYSEAFLDFKETGYFKNSQAGPILSNIQEYYSGKRQAKEIRDARREAEFE